MADQNSPAPPESAETAAPRGIRWWPAFVLLLLHGGTLATVWLVLDPLETQRGLQVVVTYIATGVMLLGLLVWELFFARLQKPWWGRVQIFLLLAAGLVIAVIKPARPDGDASFGWKFRWEGEAYESLDPEEKLAEDTGPLDPLQPTDYPGFLGENRDGIVDGVSLDTDWGAHPPRELWRIGPGQKETLGEAFSSFAIVGDRAFTQELRGGAEYTSCFRLRTGDLLWRSAQDPQAEIPPFVSAIAGNGPRATPTYHDGKLYSMGSTGILACFDAVTGKRLWSSKVFEQQTATNMDYGNACSPLVVPPYVYVSAGGGVTTQLVGYSLNPTGPHPEPVIKAETEQLAGGDFYSSPTLRTLCGVPQILFINNAGLHAFEPETLKELWFHAWPWTLTHPFVAQPVALPGDNVFISAAYMSGDALIHVERDGRGKFTSETVWTGATLKSKFANVLVQGDYIYGLDARLLVCIEWRTGKRKWKVRAGDFGHGQIMLVGNDVILVQAESGEVALVRATPKKFEELARFQPLQDQTWNNPALSGKYLLLRNHLEAVCYEVPLADEAAKKNPQ